MMVLTASVASGSTVADSFAGKPEAAPLAGLSTETGELQWRAADNFTISSAVRGGAVSLGDGKYGSAVLELPSGVAKVQLGLDVRVTSGQTGWIAVGLGSGGNLKDTVFPGGLFLYLDNNGYSQIRADGLRLKVAERVVQDFRAGDWNRLELVYDRGTNTVSATINDTIVARDLDLGEFRPTFKVAGFSNFGTAGDALVDDFSLTYEGE